MFYMDFMITGFIISNYQIFILHEPDDGFIDHAFLYKIILVF